jgi:hypothetical protein
MLPIAGATCGSVTEQRAERVVEAAGGVAKQQVGSVDPGMEAERSAAVAGERKAVASDRLRSRERLRRAIEALIRERPKASSGE